MSKTLTLTETELIKLIEDTAREHLLEREKKTDKNFDTKVRKVARRYGKLFEKFSKSSDAIKFNAWKNETINLKNQGYSDNILGEALTIHTSLLTEIELVSGGGSWIREGIWKWILGFMGIKDPALQKAIAIPLGNVGFFDLPKLLNCDYLVGVLSEGVIEYLLDVGVTMVVPGEPGMMTNGIRNVVAKTIEGTEMKQNIETQLRQMVCGKLGEKKAKVEDVMSDEKTKTKTKTKKGDDWRSKAMGFVKDELTKGNQNKTGGSKEWYDDIVQSVMAGITK